MLCHRKNIVKPKSKVQSPKVKNQRTWADTIITRLPYPLAPTPYPLALTPYPLAPPHNSCHKIWLRHHILWLHPITAVIEYMTDSTIYLLDLCKI